VEGADGDGNDDGDGDDADAEAAKVKKQRKAVLVDASVDVVLEENLYSLAHYKVQHGSVIYMFMQEYAAVIGNVAADGEEDDDTDVTSLRAADANAKAIMDAGVHTDMKQ
jgi:hypothetical protein